MSANRDPNFFGRKKRGKVIRVILEILILVVAIAWILSITVFQEKYTQVQEEARTQTDKGFVALSYFGVADVGTQTVITQERLREHMETLHAQGFKTITQQDILDYYTIGKPLPDRALFLFFEDGRRESALLAQPILESLNYIASMLAYANNLHTSDSLFLTAVDLRNLLNTSYWEIGTNGYRLSYINVFDVHENFLGELTPLEYYRISPYVRRKYNHYLMDFLRDKYDIPIESRQQMQERIAEDYEMMRDIYEKEFGSLPLLYTLMHSNTDMFATNPIVSAENEKWIKELFPMNVNRESFANNDLAASIYDLTRTQPQAYWSTNHLLMRTKYDTVHDLQFLVGDEDKASRWNLAYGAAQHKDNTIFLTSLPEDIGVIRLKEGVGQGNLYFSSRFHGNKLGVQAVDFFETPITEMLEAGVARGEGAVDAAALSVEIHTNILKVYATGSDPVFELDLDVHDGVVYQTWEEHRQEAMEVEIKYKRAQTYKPIDATRIADELERLKADTTDVNNDPFIPDISIHEEGDRFVEVWLTNGRLKVSIDGKVAVEGLDVGSNYLGGIGLRCAWAEHGYSQRNLADDVYDGVFENTYLAATDGTGAVTQVLMQYGTPGVAQQATRGFWATIQSAINWFNNLF